MSWTFPRPAFSYEGYYEEEGYPDGGNADNSYPEAGHPEEEYTNEGYGYASQQVQNADFSFIVFVKNI